MIRLQTKQFNRLQPRFKFHTTRYANLSTSIQRYDGKPNVFDIKPDPVVSSTAEPTNSTEALETIESKLSSLLKSEGIEVPTDTGLIEPVSTLFSDHSLGLFTGNVSSTLFHFLNPIYYIQEWINFSINYLNFDHAAGVASAVLLWRFLTKKIFFVAELHRAKTIMNRKEPQLAGMQMEEMSEWAEGLKKAQQQTTKYELINDLSVGQSTSNNSYNYYMATKEKTARGAHEIVKFGKQQRTFLLEGTKSSTSNVHMLIGEFQYKNLAYNMTMLGLRIKKMYLKPAQAMNARATFGVMPVIWALRGIRKSDYPMETSLPIIPLNDNGVGSLMVSDPTLILPKCYIGLQMTSIIYNFKDHPSDIIRLFRIPLAGCFGSFLYWLMCERPSVFFVGAAVNAMTTIGFKFYANSNYWRNKMNIISKKEERALLEEIKEEKKFLANYYRGVPEEFKPELVREKKTAFEQARKQGEQLEKAVSVTMSLWNDDELKDLEKRKTMIKKPKDLTDEQYEEYLKYKYPSGFIAKTKRFFRNFGRQEEDRKIFGINFLTQRGTNTLIRDKLQEIRQSTKLSKDEQEAKDEIEQSQRPVYGELIDEAFLNKNYKTYMEPIPDYQSVDSVRHKIGKPFNIKGGRINIHSFD